MVMRQGLAGSSGLRRRLAGVGQIRELGRCLCALVLDILGDGAWSGAVVSY